MTMERPSSRPPLPPREDDPSSNNRMKGKLGGITTTMGIVILVISIVVSYYMCQLVTVKPSLYNTAVKVLQDNINAVSTAQGKDAVNITQLQADVKSASTAATSASTASASAVTSVGQAISDTSNEINTMQNTLNNQETEIKALQSTISALPNTSTITQSLSDAITKLTTQLTTDEATIASLQTLITADETNIKALQAIATPTTTTTPTTTSTITPINNGVSIALTVPQIALNPANSYTNAFNITIANASSKGLYGGQIGFTLQVIGLATGETINTALVGAPLTNTYLTWRPITWTPPLQASFIGDYSGYVPANSTVTLTIQVKVISSSSNIFINIISPTIGGYTSF